MTRSEGIKGGVHPLVAAMSISSSAADFGTGLDSALSLDKLSSSMGRNLAIQGPNSLDGGGSMFSDVIPIGTNNKDKSKSMYFGKSMMSSNNDAHGEQVRGGNSKAYVFKAGFKLPAKNMEA